MQRAAPSMLKPTLIGGATAGLAGSIPFVEYLNCACCALVIGGGFFSAFLYSRDCARIGAEFRPGSGAVVGLVAGVFYAVFNVLGDAVHRLVDPEGVEQKVQEVLEQLEQSPDLPPETIDFIERVTALFASWTGLLLGFVIVLFVAAIFSTVGGLIGGATFRVEPRTDAGTDAGPVGP